MLEGENVLAVNTYECLFLLDSNRYAKDPGGVSDSLPQMIQKMEMITKDFGVFLKLSKNDPDKVGENAEAPY